MRNEPQPGRYRVKNDPVAIWAEPDGTLAATRGTRDVDPFEIWTYCCKKPIRVAVYKAILNGDPWPDGVDHIVDEERQKARQDAQVAAIMSTAERQFGPGAEIVRDETPAVIGHNSGLPCEVALDELKSLERRIKTWLDEIGTVDSEEKDAQGAKFQALVQEQARLVEEGFKTEKEPFLRGGKEVDTRWRPVKERVATTKERLSGILTKYRVERDRLRRAEEQARRAAASQIDGVPSGENPLPVEPPRAVAKGFRTYKVCVVTDPVAAATHILTQVPDQPDLLEAIRKVARKMLDAGVAVPGAEMKEEMRA
jgi:hypothetical protein